MNALAARKQLLIAESEINRSLLIEDLERATAVASVTAGVGILAWLIGRKHHAPSEERSSWWKHLTKGAGIVGTLWKIFGKRADK